MVVVGDRDTYNPNITYQYIINDKQWCIIVQYKLILDHNGGFDNNCNCLINISVKQGLNVDPLSCIYCIHMDGDRSVAWWGNDIGGLLSNLFGGLSPIMERSHGVCNNAYIKRRLGCISSTWYGVVEMGNWHGHHLNATIGRGDHKFN